MSNAMGIALAREVKHDMPTFQQWVCTVQLRRPAHRDIQEDFRIDPHLPEKEFHTVRDLVLYLELSHACPAAIRAARGVWGSYRRATRGGVGR
jgi:hypothetical protein